MADQKKVRYEVEIIGHRAPFKWRLFRIAPASSRCLASGSDSSGDAATYDYAVSEATVAAERLHDEWLHANTKAIEVVFEGDPKAPEAMAAEELERQIADLGREVDQWGASEAAVDLNISKTVEPKAVVFETDAEPDFKGFLPFPWPPRDPFPTGDIED